jgi:hypothetical protein
MVDERKVLMSEPIVFITHHRVKDGKFEALQEYNLGAFQHVHDEKPATLALLGYAGEDGSEVSFVHVFPDAEVMDLHFQGADERANKASEFIQPMRMEIYGVPNDGVLDWMNQIAESGVSVNINPIMLGGFLRLNTG